tara:strand:- start:1500 stop:1895 length:396 start_codon:yes stop_codon:yes gene_type:complete
MTAYFNHELPETSTCLKENGKTNLAPASLVDKYGQTAENVMQAVCECFDLDREDLSGKSKQQPLAWHRAIAMALTYEMTPLSLSKVARIYGRADHGTVIHAGKRVKSNMELFADPRKDVMKVIRKIKELKS